MAAMGIIFPLLPFQVLAAGAERDVVPLVFGCYAIGAFLCAPIWGTWSDKFGRKPALYASLIASSFVYFFLSQANSLFDIYLALFLAGCSAGWISIFHALAADVSNNAERTRAMGVIGASLGGGVLIGVIIGGLIAYLTKQQIGESIVYNYETAFFLSSLLYLFSFTICLTLPRAKPVARQDRPSLRSLLRFGWTSWRLILIYLIGLSAFSGLESSFAIWALQRFDAGPIMVSVALVVSGVIAVCTQGFLVGRAARIIGEKHLLMLSVALLALSYSLLALSPDIFVAIIVLSLIGIGMGMHNPCLKSWSSRVCSDRSRGSIQAALQSSSSLARILGPLLAHTVFRISDTYAIGFGYSSLYIATALLLIPSLILLSTLVPLERNPS